MDGCEGKHNLPLNNVLLGFGPAVNLVRNYDGPSDMQKISVKSCAAVSLQDTGSNANLVTSKLVNKANLEPPDRYTWMQNGVQQDVFCSLD